MKINLKPVAEMTNEEKETLQTFSYNFRKACNEMSDCGTCVLDSIRKSSHLCGECCCNFVSEIFDALGIN